MTKANIAMIAAAFAALTLSAPAVAGEIGQKTVEVDLAGIDLTSAAGMRIAERRIEAAADTVCGGKPRELGALRQFKACHSDAMTQATQQLAEIRAGRMVAQNR